MSCSCCSTVSCDIYKDHQRNLDEWFEDHVTNFHEPYYNGEGYGVEPLFEPLDAHANNQDALRKKLEAAGIDIDYCQFMHPVDGCLLGSKKPELCQKELTICTSVYKSIETPNIRFINRVKNKQFDYITYWVESGGREAEVTYCLDVLKKQKHRTELIVTNQVGEANTLFVFERLFAKLRNYFAEHPYFRLRSEVTGTLHPIDPTPRCFDITKDHEKNVQEIIKNCLCSPLSESLWHHPDLKWFQPAYLEAKGKLLTLGLSISYTQDEHGGLTIRTQTI